MKTAWIGLLACLTAGVAVADESSTTSVSTDFDPFATAAEQTAKSFDLVECCDLCRRATSGGQTKPWSFALTQTADYGTSLALPISLTPANTLLGPAGGGGPVGILNLGQADALGLLGNLGVLPIPPGPAPVGVFDDDFQFQTTAGVTYQRPIGEYGTLTASYTYYQSLHPDLDEVDLTSHTPAVQYAVQLTDRITHATYYNYQYYFLSGSSFVSQHRIGGLTTFRVNDRWDLAGGTNFAVADFIDAPYLDSDNSAGTLEATRYFDADRNNYVKAGYGGGYSDAALRGFAYQVNSGYLTFRFLTGAEKRNEWRTTGSYGRYDFIGLDPIQQTIFRADNLWNAGLFYGRRIGDNLQIFAQYSYLKSNSNVARQLYNSDLVSFGVTYTR